MNSWNYRIRKSGNQYSVIEVYYDAKGKITGWADATNALEGWDDLDDLTGTITQLCEASFRPVLLPKDLK
jgi:hypothetical protein